METPIAYDPALTSGATSSFAGERKALKSESAYRTISEAADQLGVPQHVLRFWETKFPQIRPMKRSGGRRYYSPHDIETLGTIKNFLYEQGYTIKGVQRLLRLRRGGHMAGLSLPIEALDDAVLNDDLFDTAAVTEALMLDAPPPSMDMIQFGKASEITVAEVTPVIEAMQQTLDEIQSVEMADLVEIPAHLPSKPAALMAAGLEAGRPYPAGQFAPVEFEAMDYSPVAQEAPQMGLQLSPAKRQRLECLLAEMKELKKELV